MNAFVLGFRTKKILVLGLFIGTQTIYTVKGFMRFLCLITNIPVYFSVCVFVSYALEFPQKLDRLYLLDRI